jgi:predicted AlkP superfamily pyrophosphatase or phosphodiesterase
LKIIKAFIIAMLGLTSAYAATTTRPIPEIKHVVLISLDGLRPDLALRAQMPTLRRLMTEGTYTFWATTTEAAVTLPSHTSMVTGVTPKKHGVFWNEDLPSGKTIFPQKPTIMELLQHAGYRAAMVAGKSKFATLNKPGTLSYAWFPKKQHGLADMHSVALQVEQLLAKQAPHFLFIHVADIDSAGHGAGWGSTHQIRVIEQADAVLKRIVEAVRLAGLQPSTLLLISADHGGAGTSHGPRDARSRYIPWLITGPGIKRGFDLTQMAAISVQTEDTAATVAHLFGLQIPSYFDGKVVRAAFEP